VTSSVAEFEAATCKINVYEKKIMTENQKKRNVEIKEIFTQISI